MALQRARADQRAALEAEHRSQHTETTAKGQELELLLRKIGAEIASSVERLQLELEISAPEIVISEQSASSVCFATDAGLAPGAPSLMKFMERVSEGDETYSNDEFDEEGEGDGVGAKHDSPRSAPSPRAAASPQLGASEGIQWSGDQLPLEKETVDAISRLDEIVQSLHARVARLGYYGMKTNHGDLVAFVGLRSNGTRAIVRAARNELGEMVARRLGEEWETVDRPMHASEYSPAKPK